jgi:hypothetical protein
VYAEVVGTTQASRLIFRLTELDNDLADAGFSISKYHVFPDQKLNLDDQAGQCAELRPNRLG